MTAEYRWEIFAKWEEQAAFLPKKNVARRRQQKQPGIRTGLRCRNEIGIYSAGAAGGTAT
jgi:hypothetical protein